MINIRMQSQQNRLKPKITVVGVGGAGGNAVNNMISSNLEGCEFLVCNTDAQALEGSLSPHKIQLGVNVTRGLGAGANPDIGARAADESIDEIMSYLEGSNMVFVTAGMGGGTGTGAAAVIAQAAREAGILTIGVVTKPFHFEGTHRMKLAEGGIEELQRFVDTLIVIPNQNLFRIANEKTTFADAFKMADEVLQSGVRGVTDLMVMPGLINLDFADIRTVMAEMGKAMMGTGEGEGERRSVEAAEAAISNPLLDDVSMKGARGVLINITGGYDMTLFEVDEAANRIREEVDPEANIIFGSTFDSELEGKMRVSVVATGIEMAEGVHPRPMPLPLTNTASGNEGQSRKPAAGNNAQTHGNSYTGNYAGNGGYQSHGGFDSQSAENIPASILPTQAGSYGQQPMASASRPVTAGVKTPATPTQGQQQPQTGTATPAQGAAYTATATARKMDDVETEADPSWGTKPMTQNIQRHSSPVTSRQAEQPRGMRHGNTFIPPKPVDPRGTAGNPEVDPFVEAEMDNSMRAPAKAAPKAEQPAAKTVKKAPSLFERFTGQRRHEDVVEETQQQVQQQPMTPKTAPKADTRQPELSVEQGGKTQEEDELDIPAFLRRQAN